jgi:hypothetical protein
MWLEEDECVAGRLGSSRGGTELGRSSAWLRGEGQGWDMGHSRWDIPHSDAQSSNTK